MRALKVVCVLFFAILFSSCYFNFSHTKQITGAYRRDIDVDWHLLKPIKDTVKKVRKIEKDTIVKEKILIH